MNAIVAALAITATFSLVVLHVMRVRPVHRSALAPLALVAALPLVGLFQLLPVAGPWTADPIHSLAGDVRSLAGLTGPHASLNITPSNGWRAVAMFFVPLALILAVAGASHEERKRLLIGIAAVGSFSTLLALLQSLLPGEGWLVPFEPYGRATGGLFNNVNHQGLFQSLALLSATVVYCLRTPKTLAASTLRDRRRYRGPRSVRRFWYLIAFGLWCGLGVLVSRSTAAILLFPIASLIAVWACRGLPKLPRRVLLAAGLAGSAIFVVVGWLARDWLSDPNEDSVGDRLGDVPALWDLVTQTMPWGTGLGSFAPAFQTVESLGNVEGTYLNHAHNEVLQVAIEGGLPALLLLILGAIIALRAIRRRWLNAGEPDRAAFVALGVGIALSLVHSLVDYPLRTVSVAATVSVFLALLSTSPARGNATPTKLCARHLVVVPLVGVVLGMSFTAYRLWRAKSLTHEGRFEQALRIDPNDPEALADRAWGYAVDKDFDAARKDARAAIAIHSLQPVAVRALAAAADLERGNGSADWSVAARLGWHDPVAQIVLALEALRVQDDKAAAEHVAAVVRMRALTDDFVAELRPALRRETFREALIEKVGGWTSGYEPIFTQRSADTRLDHLALARLAAGIARSGQRYDPSQFDPILARLVSVGALDEALVLHRAVADGSSSKPLYDPSRPRTGAHSPFDYQAFSDNRLRIRPGVSNDRLFIIGEGPFAATAASRLIPIDRRSMTIASQINMIAGDARVRMDLACGSRVVARSVTTTTSGPLTVRLAEGNACAAPRLAIVVEAAAGPFRLDVVNTKVTPD